MYLERYLMITEIRQQLKGTGFKIVLWLTLASMIIVFIPNLFKRGGEGYHATVATINGRDIEFIDFERRVYQETERFNMFRQQFGQQADIIFKSLGIADPKKMALNGLMQDTLLNEVADAIRVRVSSEFIQRKMSDPAYISTELADVVPFYVMDQFGVNSNLLARYLNYNRLSMQQFEQSIEDQIKRNIVLAIADASAYISAKEVKSYFMNNFLAKDYTIVSFHFEEYLKKVQKEALNETELKSYFEKEQKHYFTPEVRTIQEWKFSPQSYGITVTDQELSNYYNSHKNKYIQSPLQVQVRRILIKVAEADQKAAAAAQEKALTIKKQLQEHPEEFEKIAREFSDDKASASKGGLLDFFTKGQKDETFEKVAFRLQQDNEISDVFSTADGFEIIQRIARKPTTYKPLENVQSKIKEALKEQKFKTQFTEEATKLLNKPKDQLEKLINEFAHSKHATVQKLSIKADGSPLAERVFKLKQGEWAYLIGANEGLILNITTIEKGHKPEFTTVKKQVEADLYKEKATALINKDLEEAKGQLLETIKTKYPAAKIQKTGLLKKDDNEKLNDLAAQGFPVAVFDTLSEQGTPVATMHENNGYLITISQVEPFNQESFEAHRKKITALLYEEQKKIIQKGFIASLYRNATINLTKQLLNTQDENNL